MIGLIRDNFILNHDCQKLINYHHKNKKKIKKHVTTYDGKIWNHPLPLQGTKFFDHGFVKLQKDLNYIAKILNNSVLDYVHLVRWPIGSFQPIHKDTTEKQTTLSSILYLNSDYEGGETYLEDGTLFKPREGRVLFLDGLYYGHGVNTVSKKERYTLAAWYKSL